MAYNCVMLYAPLSLFNIDFLNKTVYELSPRYRNMLGIKPDTSLLAVLLADN